MLRKRIIVVFALAVLAVGIVAWAIRVELDHVASTSAAALHESQLVSGTLRLRKFLESQIFDADPARRSSELHQVIDDIRKSAPPGTEQQWRLNQIESLIDKDPRPGSEAAAQIRLLAEEIEFYESKTLVDRADEVRQARQQAGLVLTLGTAFIITLIAWWAVVSYRNVRESEEAQQSLKEVQHNTESILSAAGQGVFHFDNQGLILYANDAAVQLLGWSQEELIGVNGHELLHHSHQDGSPYPAEQCQIGRVIASGKPQRIKGEVYWRKDGTCIAVEYVCIPIKKAGQTTGGLVTFTDVADRDRTLNELQQANSKLVSSMDELHRRSREIKLLSELGELLQSSTTIDEACRVATGALCDLFPGGSGSICLISASRNLVEVRARWGAVSHGSDVFAPDECWALRRGKRHFTSDSQAGQCTHTGEDSAANHLCIPMMAQGEALGVLCLSEGSKRLTEAHQELAAAISEQVTLALANLRLRETLRQQSIRDPLTGLFNRRYLEESAERELRRCERHHAPLSLLMIDIDHFKHFNDNFGHEAGDLMLREIGQLLLISVRAEDIACRYGGEELAIILPEAPLEIALERAKSIKDKVSQLSFTLGGGHQLCTATVSIGVATFPDHAGSWKGIFHAADLALYHAKKSGRNCVITATDAEDTRVATNS